MITSYLLHPALFGPGLRANKKELLRLFKIILKKNGLMLIDHRARLVKLYESQINSCLQGEGADADEIRRYMDLLIEDAGQSGALRHYVKCKVKGDEDGDIISAVAQQYDPDGVIVPDDFAEQAAKTSQAEKWGASVLPLSLYEDSKVEENREAEEEAFHLTAIPRDMVRQKFIRFLRYAKVIVLYDAYFADGCRGREKWRAGVEYILDLVDQHSKMRTRSIIISFIARKQYREDGRPCDDSVSKRAAKYFYDEIFLPIKRRYCEERERQNWQFECHVKESNNDFRDRYLKTDYSILSLSHGFDFLDSRTGAFRETSIRIENAPRVVDPATGITLPTTYDIVNGYENLPEYNYLGR